jgi:hypothetical protein
MVVTVASWAGVGWLGWVTAWWGQARGPAETASNHWGLAMVLVVEAKEREESTGRVASSSSSSPRCQPDRTRVDLLARFCVGLK